MIRNSISFASALSFLIILAFSANAQNDESFFKTIPEISDETPEWAKLMYGADPNVAQVDRAYLKYFKSNGLEKNQHTQNYKHWRRIVDPYIDATGHINLELIEIAQEKQNHFEIYVRKERFNHKGSNSWTSLGPYRTIQGEGMDRSELTWQANVYCIDQSNSNPDVLYCGTEAGGVFKTIDRGQSWSWASYEGVFRTITAIQIHPTNSQVVYAGSSQNLYKTTDGGISWNSVYSENSLTINAIRVHPENTDSVFLATNNGFLRSYDGGQNWTKLFSGSACWDLELKPGAGNTIYILKSNNAAERSEFYKSTNGGQSFSVKLNGWYNSTDPNRNDRGGRMTVTPADPNRVYVILIGEAKAGDNGFIGVYKSSNSGENWTLPNPPTGGPYDPATHPNLASINPNGNGFHQGYYNLGIAASHTDADRLLIGTLSLWKSEDGAQSFDAIGGYQGSTPYVHPDQQEILINGQDMWLVNDGGINYSTNFFATNITMDSRTRGVVGSDYWGFGSGWNEDILVGGRYHNGNSGFRPGLYGDTHLRLGGAEAATGYVNPGNNKAYFSDINTKEIPYNQLDAVMSSPKLSLYPHETFYAAHSSNLEYDPNCYNHFYIGRHKEIWKSEDGGNSYALLKRFESAQEGAVMPIEISRSNPEVLYVYQRVTWCGAVLWRSDDGGVNWVQRSFPGTACKRSGTMTLDPQDENTLWVAFNNDDQASTGKIYKSNNGGQSWTDLTTSTLDGHRPHDILLQGGTNGLVYLGTDKTVFYRDNNMSDWSYLGNGLPALINVNKFQPFYKESKLRMASYGYGIWEHPFVQNSMPIIQPTVDKTTSACSRDTFYFDDFSMLDHSGVTWQWDFSPAPLYINSNNVRNPKVVFGAEDNYTVTYTVTKNGTPYQKTIQDMVSIQASECDPEIIRGNALMLRNTGDYASIPSLPVNGNEMTITAWVKPGQSLPDYTAFVLSSSGPAAGINVRPNMELGYHWPGGAWWWSSGLTVPINQWSYIALVVKPGSIAVYLNEDHAIHNTNPSSVDFQNVGALIGSYQGWSSRNYSGMIDEVSIYDRALSTEEVRKLRHLTRTPADDPSLVAYYQFNETVGPAYDKVGSLHASLNGSSSRSTSSVPAGGGESQRIFVNTGGNIDFDDVGVSIDFPNTGTFPQGDIVVSRLIVDPDQDPSPNMYVDGEYWIINNYGQNTSFTTLDAIQFSDFFVSVDDALVPGKIELFKRDSNAEGNSWVFQDVGDSAQSGNAGSVTFSTGNGINSFSQFSLVGDVSLPLELLSFNARLIRESEIELNWITANAFNTDRFHVEKANANLNFSDIGEITFVEGKDSYKFLDLSPFIGSNFYRLRIEDNDGTVTYSKIQHLLIRAPKSPLVLSPNPLPSGKQLQILFLSENPFEVSIFDASGKLVINRELTGISNDLDLNLSPGIYMVSVRTENTMHFEKLIIQ